MTYTKYALPDMNEQSLSLQQIDAVTWFGSPSLSSKVVNLMLTRECLASLAVETQRRQVATTSSVSARTSHNSAIAGTVNELTRRMISDHRTP